MGEVTETDLQPIHIGGGLCLIVVLDWLFLRGYDVSFTAKFCLPFLAFLLLSRTSPAIRAWRWCRRTLLVDPPASEGPQSSGPVDGSGGGSDRWWVLAGILLILVAFALLQSIESYYFTQDDNLVQFLPVILQGCESMVRGIFPTWNPYQFMGAPTTSLGTYALTYPGTLISYLVSRFLWGDPRATLEVFALLHLLSGFLATFYLARVYGCRSGIAFLGAISIQLSGYSLIVGRCWYYMLPVNLWVPLLLLAARFLPETRHPHRWWLLTGTAIGLFFHAGNAQMWLYAILFLALYLVLRVSCEPSIWRRLWPSIPALLLGLALSSPILLPQLLETRNAVREGADNMILTELDGMLLPYPLAQARDPMGWGSRNIHLLGHMYYAGTLFQAMGMLCLLFLPVFRWRREDVRANPWLVLSALALVLVIGRDTLVYETLFHLPIFNKLKHSMKFIPYFHLLATLGGMIVLERWARRRQLGNGSMIVAAVAFSLLMLFHVGQCRTSFYSYGFRPYPEMPPELLTPLQPEKAGTLPPRISIICPSRNIHPSFGISLQHNLPTLHQIPSDFGYDPLISENASFSPILDQYIENSLEALQRWGVRTVVHSPLSIISIHGEAIRPRRYELGFWLVNRAQVFGEENPLSVFHLTPDFPRTFPRPVLRPVAGVDPLAFLEGHPEVGWEIEASTRGLRITPPALPEAPGTLILAFLARPFYRATVDGNAVPLSEDRIHRMTLPIPAGTRGVTVEYDPPFLQGLAIGLLLLVLASASAWGLERALTQPLQDTLPKE